MAIKMPPDTKIFTVTVHVSQIKTNMVFLSAFSCKLEKNVCVCVLQKGYNCYTCSSIGKVYFYL